MTNLYISPDLGTSLSGNLVSIQQLEALESLKEPIIKIGRDQISPTKFLLPNSPFLQDYLTMDLVSRMELNGGDSNFAFLYAGPFTNTIRYLKAIGMKTVLSYDAHSREESIKEFGNLGYQYPHIHVKDDYQWNMYFACAKEADVLICPSKLSESYLRQEGCKQTINVIPHGIDVPTSDKIKSITDKFTVGYMGQCGPDKGLKYLIQSWSQLDYKDNELLFGGNGTEQLKPIINRYATTGLFRLIGYVEDKEQFFNNISIYIQPSVTESFGITTLEAMSYGRPVIVSEGAGVVDTITNGENGFIVPKRDPKAIADKIQYFKDNPKEIERMGKNARKTAENYSWDKIKEQYVNIFRTI